MKYLAECDLIVEDLHSGDPNDVKLALQALSKHKFEEEKVLILISSLMAWNGTPNKMEEIKTREQMEAEKKATFNQTRKAEDDGDGDGGDKDNQDKEPSERNSDDDDIDRAQEVNDKLNEDESVPEFVDLPMPKKIRRKFKHQAFTEKDYQMRDPIEEYRIIKEIEDEVLNFKKENVRTYVISAGILYGKGEAIFNSHI